MEAALDAAEADAPLEADADAAQETCAPLTDQQMCSWAGKACGTFTGVDPCGTTRTVSCGGCAGGALCGGDGVENACGSWWSCDWQRRARVELQATDAVAVGYSVKLVFDHAKLVAAGQSRADGQDVRVVRRQADTWTEVARVLDPESSWGSTTTTLWFKLQEALAAGSQNSAYYLHYGNANAGPPMADEAQVFHFADFFDRADNADVGNGWELFETASTDIRISGNALWFQATADASNRPSAERNFAPLTGRMELRLGFNWVRSGAEGTYRLHMQLGSSAAMHKPPPSDNVWVTTGVGPSLLWAGQNQGMTNHEGFGYAQGTAVTEVAVATGKTPVRALVRPAAGTFDLTVGSTTATTLPFSSTQTTLDRLRLMAWQINQDYFGSRGFDYVLVRPRVAVEPSLSVPTGQLNLCQP
jgi:hypothetical protein